MRGAFPGIAGILSAANCTRHTDLTAFLSDCPARIRRDFPLAVLAVTHAFRASLPRPGGRADPHPDRDSVRPCGGGRWRRCQGMARECARSCLRSGLGIGYAKVGRAALGGGARCSAMPGDRFGGDAMNMMIDTARDALRATGTAGARAPGLNGKMGEVRRSGDLTSGDDAAAIMVAGSPGRRVAGSPGRRVAGSPGRRVAGSPGRPTCVFRMGPLLRASLPA